VALWAAGVVSGVFGFRGRVVSGGGGGVGGGEVDVEAEGAQLLEVAADAAVAVGLAQVPVGSEILVAGCGVGQQVPVR